MDTTSLLVGRSRPITLLRACCGDLASWGLPIALVGPTAQEVSSATNETAFDAPVISTREAATQVLVRDSQTVVLGGLIDDQREETGGGVPYLSDLPLLGGLFGRRTHRTSGTELFLFLTPRVLRTDAEVDAATNRFPRER